MLTTCSPEEKNRITALLESSADAPLVRTTFDLDPVGKDAVARAIHTSFGTQREVLFKTDPSLTAGIELTLDGHSLAWNINAYVSSLRNTAASIVDGSKSGKIERGDAENND